MKLKLNKKKLKNLSKDNKALPLDMTPQVGGGNWRGVTQTSLACNYSEGPYRCFSVPDTCP